MNNILIKLGGSVITDVDYRKAILDQIVEIKKHNYNLGIVHGGGKLISNYLSKLDIKSEFYEGLRITSEEALDVVMMVLIGKVNKDIVKDFNNLGSTAIGLCGGDGLLIEAEKHLVNGSVDIGRVGIPVKVNTNLYKTLSEMGYIIVLATIGFGDKGYYNINADHTAAFIASQLKVDHLIYVSDVDGVLHPETNQIFLELNRHKIDSLKNNGIITGGMLPKLYSCLDAIDNGVSKVSIINGKTPNSLFETIVDKKLVGTQIL